MVHVRRGIRFFTIGSAVAVLVAMMTARPTRAVQRRTECDDWANDGECEANPGYMLNNCKQSCDRHEQRYKRDVGGVASFFDLSARDIDRNLVEFEQFRGRVTIVANVASYCGYTESHYTELVNLYRSVSQTGMVEILAFPCNQFGHQEPDDGKQIKEFAREKGVEFVMMDKIDVNGINADPVYKYLKKVAGTHKIAWNFGTYFVIDPVGNVQAYSGVNPSQLEKVAFEALGDEL